MRAPKSLILGSMPRNADPETYLAGGPWCFCGQEEAFPDWPERFTFAPEPLADPNLIAAAARAAQTLACQMIKPIAKSLGADWDKVPATYWQILLLPWLINVSSQIIDRAIRLKAMLEAWAKQSLIVPVLPKECSFNFIDEQDFTMRGSLGIAFNHWLFSRLLADIKPDKWQIEELPLPRPQHKGKSGKSLKGAIKEKLRSISLKLAFPRAKGMSVLQAMNFSRALNHPCKSADHSLDIEQAFNFQSDLDAVHLPDDIDEIIANCLPESLKNLKHPPIGLTPEPPRLKIVNILAHEDCRYRQQLAIWRANGNRLAHSQHGGNYGMLRTSCAAPLIEYSQDIFFTWGWKRHGGLEGNFVPLPSVQLSGIRGSWNGRNKKTLLFVGTEMSTYGHRLDSLPTPLQYVKYRQAKAEFFNNLKPEILAHSFYRPYFPLPGTLDDAKWLLPKFPGLSLCQGELLPQLLRCRLLVIDHHGTTLLEAMSADIPVILYWQREFWPLSAEADILLDLLEACGIWHPNAEKAARKVNEIWDDTRAWWQSPQIRAGRKVFCKHQALTSEDPDAVWIKYLQQI